MLLKEELIFNEILISLYAKAWNGAYDALNQSSYLQNLRALNNAIRYHNQSLPFDNNEEEGIEQFFRKRYRPVLTDTGTKSNSSKDLQ